ncbi:MAG TPA: translation elongation factor Ts [Anaerolineae bacterium]|jgi:elongation factor Ts|nr:translation elongation factor Ts [Anaerolineae bacterium]
MKITTDMIKELRDATGAGVLEVKKALEAAGGDTEQALGTLREKGAIQAAKRSERVAREGVVEVYAHPGSRVGVMLELNCETDFVARNERFVAFAHDLALHVAAMQPAYVNREEVPQDEVDSRSKEYREDAIVQGKPEEIANKIVEGRLNKFYEENCLLEQGFVKDDDVKVQQLLTDLIGVLGENIVVRRFIRYELGEEAT